MLVCLACPHRREQAKIRVAKVANPFTALGVIISSGRRKRRPEATDDLRPCDRLCDPDLLCDLLYPPFEDPTLLKVCADPILAIQEPNHCHTDRVGEHLVALDAEDFLPHCRELGD